MDQERKKIYSYILAIFMATCLLSVLYRFQGGISKFYGSKESETVLNKTSEKSHQDNQDKNKNKNEQGTQNQQQQSNNDQNNTNKNGSSIRYLQEEED